MPRSAAADAPSIAQLLKELDGVAAQPARLFVPPLHDPEEGEIHRGDRDAPLMAARATGRLWRGQSELLSDPKMSADLEATLREVPLLDTSDGYWARAGRLRATVLARRRKARLGDALNAQSCVDHRLPLLTRDRDFRAFADAAGLDIVVGGR